MKKTVVSMMALLVLAVAAPAETLQIEGSTTVGPIADAFGVDDLIATDPEIVDGRYTGKVAGTPCFQKGKITRLQQWLENTHHDLVGSTFYSDSHNDIPLLEIVDTPIAVDPDDELRALAEKNSWQIRSFR